MRRNHLLRVHSLVATWFNLLNSSLTLWTCTKSQKDGQNYKNTGVRRAILPKCPSRRANPSLDGRLWHTAHLLDKQFNMVMSIMVKSVTCCKRQDNFKTDGLCRYLLEHFCGKLWWVSLNKAAAILYYNWLRVSPLFVSPLFWLSPNCVCFPL